MAFTVREKQLGICCRLNELSTPAKLFAGCAIAPIIYLVGKEVITKIGMQYEYWQNSKIGRVDCHIGEFIDGKLRDYKFFERAAESGKAVDEYCFGIMILKTDDKKVESILKARGFLKSALEKGLNAARKPLCQPGMYPEGSDENYKKLKLKFGSFCCPPAPRGSLQLAPICSWSPNYKNFTFYDYGGYVYPDMSSAELNLDEEL
jgi:hypothetical protein